MDACDGQTTRRERLVYVAAIEERFLPAQADAFTGSELEEKASACSARNDSSGWATKSEMGQGSMTG